MTVILLRHGASVWNELGRVQGQSTAAPGLSAAGWRQAGRAAENLERTVNDRPVRLVASDLLRAVETAKVLAARFGDTLTIDPRFRELDYGHLTGRYRNEPWDGGPVGARADAVWADVHVAAPGGERADDLITRTRSGLLDHAQTALAADQLLIVVAHGGVLKGATRLVRQAAGEPDPPAIHVGNTDLLYVPHQLLQPDLAPCP